MPKKNYKIGFIADPLENFDPINETTSFIMHEMTRRRWTHFHIELKDIYLTQNTVKAKAKEVHTTKNKNRFSHEVIKTHTLDLAKVDALFLRKDPPVDLNFIDHLTVLETIADKTFMVNHPTWVKHANEKLFTFYFSDIIPEAVVSQNSDIIKSFVKKYKSAVLKPLNLSGGRGVVKVNHSDPSLSSLIDILSENETRYILAQKYLPASQKGDKRILILDGEILGGFLRVPHKNDFRGNLHSGAKLIKTKLSANDRKIVERISPTLKKLNLFFVGIDIIGNYVTEINVTSPMGIGEINQLNNSHTEKTLVNWLQEKLS